MRMPGRPRWCKAVWGVVIMTLMIFTGFMICELLTDYFAYNSFNSLKTQWYSNVTLPAITICSTNPLNWKALNRYSNKHDVDLFKKIMARIEVVEADPRKNFTDSEKEEITEIKTWEKEKGPLSLRFLDYINETLRGEFHFKHNSVGVRMSAKREKKATQVTELGNCFELNDSGRYVQDRGGYKGGFSFDLDANIDAYLESTETQGFILYIRDRDETVMLNQGGLVFSPGTETFISLKARHIERLGEPHGTCQNVESALSKYGVHYETVRECVQRQKIDMMVKVCNCIPWYLAERLRRLKKSQLLQYYMDQIKEIKNNKKRSADPVEKTAEEPESATEPIDRNSDPDEWITERTERATDEYHEGGKEVKLNFSYVCGFIEGKLCTTKLDNRIRSRESELDECPEPCEHEEWERETFQAQFPPSQHYFEKFLKKSIKKMEPDLKYEYAKSNIARVHIYYEQIKVDEITQTKAYEPQNFIAQFGGTVDLFIGFSFFTVFQLLEIGIAFCIAKIRKRMTKNSDKNKI